MIKVCIVALSESKRIVATNEDMNKFVLKHTFETKTELIANLSLLAAQTGDEFEIIDLVAPYESDGIIVRDH